MNAKRLLATLVCAIGAVVAAAGGSVAAHTELDFTLPADGTTVGEPVSEISVGFTEPVTLVGNGFEVLDPGGTVIEPFPVTDDDKVFRLQFDPPLAGGPVGVRYQVTAEDGHELDGLVRVRGCCPGADHGRADHGSSYGRRHGAVVHAVVDVRVGHLGSPDRQRDRILAPRHDEAARRRRRQLQSQHGDRRGGSGRCCRGGLPRRSFSPPTMIVAGVVWPGITHLREVVHLSTTPLDEFLNGDTSNHGETWRQIGLGLELFAALAGAGLLVFLFVCLEGRHRDVRRLTAIATGCGAALAAGAAIELIGIAAQFDVDWWDVFDLDASSAPMLRLLAGVLLLFGLEDPAALPDSDHIDEHDACERWRPGAGSAFGVSGAAAGVVSFAFDGHTVSQGPRAVHALVDIAHVFAAATWVGGILALVVLMAEGRRRRVGGPTPATLIRFSRLATWALVVVTAAGVTMMLMIADSIDDLTGTPWGRRLIVKTVAVGAATLLAGYNHFALVPRLRTEAPAAPTMRRLLASVAIELVVLSVVVAGHAAAGERLADRAGKPHCGG